MVLQMRRAAAAALAERRRELADLQGEIARQRALARPGLYAVDSETARRRAAEAAAAQKRLQDLERTAAAMQRMMYQASMYQTPLDDALQQRVDAGYQAEKTALRAKMPAAQRIALEMSEQMFYSMLFQAAIQSTLLRLLPARGAPGIVRGANPSRVTFEGMEVRAVRDLSHLDAGTLRAMQQRGFAATDINGQQLQLHHLNQNPAGPLVEIPAPAHNIANPVQHPFGNQPGAGLTAEQRAAFNDWRIRYWQERAMEELARRGLR
jgi:hypothetical protein